MNDKCPKYPVCDGKCGDFYADRVRTVVDLIRWARNGEQWAQASCDRLGLVWRITKEA